MPTQKTKTTSGGERKKRQFCKLNRYEKAILHLAEMMENPVHDQYQIFNPVLEVLGIELVPPPLSKKVIKRKR